MLEPCADFSGFAAQGLRCQEAEQSGEGCHGDIAEAVPASLWPSAMILTCCTEALPEKDRRTRGVVAGDLAGQAWCRPGAGSRGVGRTWESAVHGLLRHGTVELWPGGVQD